MRGEAFDMSFTSSWSGSLVMVRVITLHQAFDVIHVYFFRQLRKSVGEPR